MSTNISGYDILEPLHESDSTLVLRGRRARDSRPVILKILKPENATPAARARFQNEFETISKLTLPGICQAYSLEPFADSLVMVLEDIGGRSLDQLLTKGPLSIPRFLQAAIALADILETLHRQHFIHKAINPSNIIVNPDTWQLRLIDFDLADELPQWNAGLQPPAAPEGDLRYTSPEQTGRLNRLMDYRTDLYSLGAVFYEMLTGRPPFAANDLLEAVHSHIAKVPAAPCDADPAIPPAISGIIMKLLSKMAEDRYQSAWGLNADLERCLREIDKPGGITCFSPGDKDVSDRFSMPQKLYGRGEETAKLTAAFERASTGSMEIFMLTGAAGTGKTALAHELQPHLTAKNALFIEGKFELLQRGTPYSGWNQAFHALAHSLLMETEPRLAEWKSAILSAAGPNGKILTDLIPDLELIIGAQPPVPEIPPAGNQLRLSDVLNKFLKTVAGWRHPLVLFLDDLQWADPASLKLLADLASDAELKHFLLLGAYRDSEVGPRHPLTAALERIRESGARTQEIPVPPLFREALSLLLSDAFSSPPFKTASFAQLLHEKTRGNPFFVGQFLRTLYQEGLVECKIEGQEREWKWDLARIREKGFTENAAALMVAKLEGLGETARRLLQMAACIGRKFDLGTLAGLAGTGEQEALQALKEPLREGLLLPRNGNSFSFIHDRAHQAAYSDIPAAQRAELHLVLGRMLLSGSNSVTETDIFHITEHLNLGATLSSDKEERYRFAQAYVLAGKKAMATTAYASASIFFSAGIALLSAYSWTERHELTFTLQSGLAEASFLNGTLDEALRHCDAILRKLRTNAERVKIYDLKIGILTTRGDIEAALAAGGECLRLLGIDLPLRPTKEHLDTTQKLVGELLAGREIEDLAALPAATDRDKEAALCILAAMHPPSHFIKDPGLYLLIPQAMMTLILRHGNTPDSPIAYCMYSSFLTTSRRFEEAYRFLNMACKMVAPPSPQIQRTKVYFLMGASPFFAPLPVAQNYLDRAMQAAIEGWDLPFTCYCQVNSLAYSYIAGTPLDEVLAESTRCMELMLKAKFNKFHNLAAIIQRLIQSLRGRATHPGSTADPGAGEKEFEEHVKPDAHTWCWHKVLKMQSGFITRDFAAALSALEETLGLMPLIYNEAATIDSSCFAVLTLAACHAQSSAEKKNRLKAIMDDQLLELKTRAHTCPETYLCRDALARAEAARIEGHELEAMGSYEEAIREARRNGFIQIEALSCELSARFWLEKGNVDFAQVRMKKAHMLYGRWQARAKARALLEEFPEWLSGGRKEAAGGSGPEASIQSPPPDVLTMLKAAQTISSEIKMDRMLAAMMGIVIENAGAETGLLVLERGGRWVIAAEGDSVQSRAIPPPGESVDEATKLSAGIIRYVSRTAETVVLDDAARQGDFASDPYVSGNKVKSLLCAPLLTQGKLVGILYLENNLSTGTFSPERVQFLTPLLSQAAVALENASVYEALHAREATLRESESKYRRIVDTANEGIWVLDQDLRCAFVNDRMAAMLGYTPGEMLGRDIRDFVFEGDLETHEERMSARRRGLAKQYERRWRRKDGGELWTIVSAKPNFDARKRFLGTFAMVTDITTRKRAERNLIESESKYRRLIETLNEGVWMFNPEGRTVYVNPRIAEMLGCDAGDMLGRPLTAFTTAESGQTSFTKAPDDKRAFKAQYDIELLKKDGTPVYAIFETTPVTDDAGNFTGTLSAVTDITERIKLQKDLELEKKLNAKTEELRLANIRLQGMDQLKSVFIASVSHELRTPLNSIIGFSSILLKGWCGAINAEQKENLATIFTAGKHLHMLINDIIDVSKIEADKLECSVEEFDLRDLVMEALNMAGPENSGGEVKFSASAPNHPMRTDRRRLLQCLVNLLSNAAKFTPEGSVSVKAEVHSAPGDTSLVEITVTDTGIGIKEEDLPRLFSPFSRLQSSLTDSPKGTGLGLHLVKKIVTEVLRGDVSVKSVNGKGSTFGIRIPARLPQE